MYIVRLRLAHLLPTWDIEPDKDLATAYDDDKVRLTKYYGLVPRYLLTEAQARP